MTEDIYDTPTGKILLIPQGARLIGQYDAQAAFGQSRALLVWNCLIMPNGRSIVPERQPGRDPEGHAGLEDQVDNHSGVRAVEVDKPVKVTIDLPAIAPMVARFMATDRALAKTRRAGQPMVGKG